MLDRPSHHRLARSGAIPLTAVIALIFANNLPAEEPNSAATARPSPVGRTVDPEISQHRGASAATERIPDRLQGAGARLQRWHEIDAEAQQVTAARAQLAHRGSIPDLKREIGRGTGQAEAEANLMHIFRKPEHARATLERSYAENGHRTTYRQLAERPQEFGKLRGLWQTQTREDALRLATSNGRRAVEGHDRHQKLQGDLEQAEGYRLRQLSFREEQGGLAKERADLVADVGRQAEGLNLEQLNLTDRQRSTLQTIRGDEARHLIPLREAIRQLDAAGKAKATGKAITKTAGKVSPIAQRVAKLYTAAPKHIIRRLSPPQIRTALAAVNLIRRLARTAERGMSPGR